MTRPDSSRLASAGALVTGTYLRSLRQDRGLPLAHAAAALGENLAIAHQIETGQLCPDEIMVDALLRAYGSASPDDAQALLRFLDDAAHGRQISHDTTPGWRARLAACERAAHTTLTYSTTLTPAILRTAAYAIQRGTTPYGHRPGKAIGVRYRAAGHDGSRVVVLDESVLMRAVGGPALMRDQLTHLIEAATAGVIRLRVLPLAAPLTGAAGTLSELWLPHRRLYAEESHGAHYSTAGTDSADQRHLLHTALANSLGPRESLERLRQARDTFATAASDQTHPTPLTSPVPTTVSRTDGAGPSRPIKGEPAQRVPSPRSRIRAAARAVLVRAEGAR